MIVDKGMSWLEGKERELESEEKRQDARKGQHHPHQWKEWVRRWGNAFVGPLVGTEPT